ncbi:NmrA/HSCARG family protein [Ralstonia pseudosolanacearum]|uniref:NmrA/HSCARG family protein n=1 Tax=Ralstonia pseudosolanacearum TaxID=1310165 RepID=UPI002676BAFC|nr:NmrA/HSCARG family protein [Ralstonia pseudosolanacearum]MDO3526389.1 NmrA/HSCARG family protein [Ralstonia pseudosolanacearum]
MTMKKTIVVVGATGGQGGGLARAILNDPDSAFRVRAVVRNPSSEKAMELARLGAEVVQADLNDLPSLKLAFQGAYGAFCVTSFYELFSPEKEIAQAANMAEAAKDAGLEHVIWSTLEDTRKLAPLNDNRISLMGNYKVPQSDSKGEANREFTDRGVPTTFLLTSFFWENFINYELVSPKKGPDGVLGITLTMADKKLPGIGVEDIGKCAYGIFKRGSDYIGKTVGIAGEHLTGEEMAAAFSKALGQAVRYNPMTDDAYASTFAFPGVEIMVATFQFQRDFNADYCAARDPAESKLLNPEIQSFEAWLALNRARIPL